MITLLNGRGQLGTAISKRLKEIEYVYSPEVLIYHTWNIEDKQKHLQELELEKFKPIVDTNTDKKIIFISTSSQRESWYTHYKQLAESYLLQKCENGFSLRFPTLIGKGVLEDLKTDTSDPYGDIELMSIEDAAVHTINKINYSGIIKSFTFQGLSIPADMVQKLLKFEVLP